MKTKILEAEEAAWEKHNIKEQDEKQNGRM